MKKVLSVLLALAMVIGIGVCGAVTASAATDITSSFTDPNFRAAVYQLIGKTAPAPILDTDVAGITELDVTGAHEYNQDTGVYTSLGSIKSLAGLAYFTNLRRLYCNYNQLASLPALPSSLEDLSCAYNQLTSLPALPGNLRFLWCVGNRLTSLPALPAGFEVLWCANNQLTVLPALPAGLEQLLCFSNRLTTLPALPASLKYLHCDSNQLTSLPALPVGLEQLYCGDNPLTMLPALPPGLRSLYCTNNQLTVLPELPAGLKIFWCRYNQLTALPALPSTLVSLRCEYNQLTSLDVTGLMLDGLDCHNNYLPGKSAVIGFTGVWDGVDFVFDPQIDKTALIALLIQARAIEKGNYTDYSWDRLQSAIASAQEVVDNASTSQLFVSARLTALQNAINGLRENPPPPPTPTNTIPGTSYEATIINWILYIVFFGWLWMRF